MNVWEYVLGILLIAVSVALVIVILFQKDRASTSRNALDTSDSSDSYYGKNKGRSKDAVMGKVTRVLAVAMFVLTIAINLFILAPKYKADQAASSAAAASASAASASAASESAASASAESASTASGSSTAASETSSAASDVSSEVVSSSAETSSSEQ